ncbi:MAG: hypothetical protein ACKOX3_08745 [Bacteroidota bacterium]
MRINNNIGAVFLLSLLALFFSCSSRSASDTESKSNTLEGELQSTHGIIDQYCSSDANLQFSYYLPLSFKSEKKYPVFILFDPHGDGHFAIEKYQAIADKYEYILLSTNAIKNGVDRDAAAHTMQCILNSAITQIPGETTRVYVGGFSGGARYASMLGMSGSGIQGLMVAGAGFPADAWNGLTPSVIIAAANDGDMNLPEILALNQIKNLQQRGRLLTFRDSGTHEWPSADKMEEMLAIFTAFAIRDSLEKNTSKLDTVIATYQKLAKSNYCKNTLLHQALFYERAIKVLDGLTDVQSYKQKYSTTISSSNFKSDQALESLLLTEEGSLKNNYYQAMGSRDTLWWSQEMAKLNNSIKTGKDALKQAQLMRVRNGVSLMCYMNLDKTMKANSNQDANYLSVLYRNIDPDNSESWFLAAVMEARNKNKNKSYDFLKTAGQKGFKDRNRVNQTNEFNQWLGDPQFQDIVNHLPN